MDRSFGYLGYDVTAPFKSHLKKCRKDLRKSVVWNNYMACIVTFSNASDMLTFHIAIHVLLTPAIRYSPGT